MGSRTPPPAPSNALLLAKCSPKCDNSLNYQVIHVVQASSLSPAKAKWNRSTGWSDACQTPPTPPRLLSQLPAAGSAPSLPAPSPAVQPGNPPRRPGMAKMAPRRQDLPPEYGGAFLPATHNRQIQVNAFTFLPW